MFEKNQKIIIYVLVGVVIVLGGMFIYTNTVKSNVSSEKKELETKVVELTKTVEVLEDQSLSGRLSTIRANDKIYTKKLEDLEKQNAEIVRQHDEVEAQQKKGRDESNTIQQLMKLQEINKLPIN